MSARRGDPGRRGRPEVRAKGRWGAGGTGMAYLLYFGLIARVGATKTSTVTYPMPAITLFYGAVFLGEALALRALVGLALILAGVASATGAIGLPERLRREPPAPDLLQVDTIAV